MTLARYKKIARSLLKDVRVRSIALGVLGVVAGALYFVWWLPPAGTVYLRDDGFHPEEIAVGVGETVTFVNKSSHPFWPASNAHPQHDQFVEFDAGQPLAPGMSWTFKFTREGKWGYHDHIRSYYAGTVYVGEAALSYNCVEHIAELNVSDKRECWDEELAKTMRSEGAQAAFKKFAAFYASDPDFTQIGCHSTAHRMGDVAYGEYVRYGNDLSRLQFPPESLYCGYGYYHGIMEHMIRDNPDFATADAFCKELIDEYEDTVPRIRLNCYHAIGHGFIPEPSDVEMWGDPFYLTDAAHAACRNLTDLVERSECFQGSFNVLADWMWNNQFGFRFPEEDSLALCREFDDPEISKACYYELSMKVIALVDDDIAQVYKRFAADIADDEIAGMVINSAAAGIVGRYISGDTFIPFLMDCRTLPLRVQVDCMKGLTGGFAAHGEPEKEYEKAVAFCIDSILTPDEKKVCYSNIFRTFQGIYSPEKITEVCDMIEPAYREYCTYSS